VQKREDNRRKIRKKGGYDRWESEKERGVAGAWNREQSDGPFL